MISSEGHEHPEYVMPILYLLDRKHRSMSCNSLLVGAAQQTTENYLKYPQEYHAPRNDYIHTFYSRAFNFM